MKNFYIIPGWKEYSRYKVYQSLALAAKKGGYKVIFYEIDWDKKLSEQVFPVEKNSIVFGFSLGAILALLIAQKYECRKLLLASMTPLYSFKDKKIKKALIDLLGADFINDIDKNLKTRNKSKEKVIIYGDKEGEKGDIIIPKTGPRLNSRYIEEIKNLL